MQFTEILLPDAFVLIDLLCTSYTHLLLINTYYVAKIVSRSILFNNN